MFESPCGMQVSWIFSYSSDATTLFGNNYWLHKQSSLNSFRPLKEWGLHRFLKNLSKNILKADQSNNTKFNPPLFSLVNTFKKVYLRLIHLHTNNKIIIKTEPSGGFFWKLFPVQRERRGQHQLIVNQEDSNTKLPNGRFRIVKQKPMFYYFQDKHKLIKEHNYMFNSYEMKLYSVEHRRDVEKRRKILRSYRTFLQTWWTKFIQQGFRMEHAGRL